MGDKTRKIETKSHKMKVQTIKNHNGDKKHADEGTRRKNHSFSSTKKKRGNQMRARQEQNDDDTSIVDPRFQAMSTRPQFQRLSAHRDDSCSSSKEASRRGSDKAEIDERFAKVLTDPRFRVDGLEEEEEEAKGIDRFGRRKKKKKKKDKKDGKYECSSTALHKAANDGEASKTTMNHGGDATGATNTDKKVDGGTDNDNIGSDTSDAESSSSSSSSSSFSEDNDGNDKMTEDVAKKNRTKATDSDIDPNDPESRIAYLTALSRGLISGSSSSDSSSFSSDENDSDSDTSSDRGGGGQKEEDSIYGTPGILDPSFSSNQLIEGDDNVPRTTESSPYLAILNLDWANIRAVDLLAILQSFTSPGSVKSVKIYPSDFGLEQMAKEERYGPIGLWKKTKHKKNKGEENKKQMTTNEEEDTEEEATKNHDDDSSVMSDDGVNKEGNNNNEQDVETKSKTKDDKNLSDCDSEQQEEAEEESAVDELDKHYKDPSQQQQQQQQQQQTINSSTTQKESDFDPEKLRAYEASKLRYYFAVAKFHTPTAADVAYNELDGMELERSSAALDLRLIPMQDLPNVVKGRTIRDEATVVPSNYRPSTAADFVVDALQRTTVRCTWEEGDVERERTLSKLCTLNALNDDEVDVRAYLASDDSSDDDDDDDSDDEVEEKSGRKKERKGARMRKLLGLGGSDDEEGNPASSTVSENDGEQDRSDDQDGETLTTESDAKEDSDDEKEAGTKEFTFIPGARKLEEKIRSKLESEEKKDLTPWEKYQQKRKEKRRERRKAAREKKRGDGDVFTDRAEDADRLGAADDDFFLEESKRSKNGGSDEIDAVAVRKESTKEELDLLLAGDEDEDTRDYDMRGLLRIEKNAGKKLRGSRKRREAELAANVSGTGFALDTSDERFAALLDGTDERFGIDRMDPSYKDTPAMRELLAEQSRRRRRRKKRARTDEKGQFDTSRDEGKDGGARDLNSLVRSLKAKMVGK